jgi:carbon starvation protein
MFAGTLSSLFLFAVKNYNDGIYILAVLAGVLFLLALVLIYLGK